ncbi:MAG: glutamate synthase large subunit, partial [Alphaproteobacteria bacterium]
MKPYPIDKTGEVGRADGAPRFHISRTNGLYDPRKGQDSCGVGFVVNLSDERTHQIVADGLRIVENLTHRGASGADPRVGDGAGMIIQIPHRLFGDEAARLGFSLPAAGEYAVGMMFFPQNEQMRAEMSATLERTIADEGMSVLGWRDVPVNNSKLSPVVTVTEPFHRQIFIGRRPDCTDEETFERQLFVMRKRASGRVVREFGDPEGEFYFASLSCRTIVYKGMFLAHQLGAYYRDLKDERFESALALVHQRFSTNTFPSWRLAHPYRMIAHNGEINTVRGNVNWMAARQASVESKLYGDDISKLWPISREGQSDTACFDNTLEFLTRGGYALPHAAMMMIPEAWAGNPLMGEDRRAFYEYHAALMEPWDGPAAIAFTDGRKIGATLDRNGLRPARYCVTHDGVVVMASEAGVLPIEESRIATKWRLQPGLMLLIDLDQKRMILDDELKSDAAKLHPYEKWLARTQTVLEDLPTVPEHDFGTTESLLDRQQAFGYTQEDLDILMKPMAVTGAEGIGSMGTDTPISALSDQSKLLYTYFKQNFAQVTNPPIDPIREELVMSLVSFIGPRPNILDLEGESERKRLEVRQPILTDIDLEKIRQIGDREDNPFSSQTLNITFEASSGAAGMVAAIEALCEAAEVAVHSGHNIVILSDRTVGRNRAPIPALLATAAVHHHLIRKGLRTTVGLVVETGEAREVHHFCCLAGYGAEAINPYLAFETLAHIGSRFGETLEAADAIAHYIKAIGKGIHKVMSKMGISTYQSYCGAQIFDAVGLSSEFVDRFFTGTATTIEGVGIDEVAAETLRRHERAFVGDPVLRNSLAIGGEYRFRHRGEEHVWNFETVRDLQHAVRGEGDSADESYASYARRINDQSEELLTIRGLFELRSAAADGRKSVPIEEVEPAADIVKRFATGAMSYGSISREAHTTLAIAMNRIGGKSNTGEGGEEPDRFVPMPNGDSMRSAIKQVASGRFGVTTEYLVNSDMIQIKMAQGAKPGEGGQLPGHKVDATIAKVRYSTPGVGLISPPPHHDIYSIEDLKQLIFDLKNVNPGGWVSVKLVSEVGVGTVAAGVSKAKADHVTISGFEGGTGASPLTSIKHAGSPWEIGLSETHQTLVANELRGRISVQVDGGIRTGRDVVIGALLGADEFGFSTAPLIAAGCVMMRKCHLNTCPVGIATQDPVLRKRFTGTPEQIVNYFFYVAEEVRQLMAELGYRRFDDMIGQMQMLDSRKNVQHWKAHGLDFARLFAKPEVRDGVAIYRCEDQDHELDTILDKTLIKEAQPALDNGRAVQISQPINNTDRSAGAMLSGKVARRHGHNGLPDDTIHIAFTGTAGQSFGAWATYGVTLDLVGEANDYVGKGLSGGRIVIRPSPDGGFVPEESIIVGNTVLYGAIAGECYFRGISGERFAVRNSGAVAVVEGAGDHCCEYMTGGVVVVLGRTGRNFAAGMSGGIAYVLDEDESFEQRCNMAMIELE